MVYHRTHRVVLELCCFEWFQNNYLPEMATITVLELCCFEWFQNIYHVHIKLIRVLELCCFEWFQNQKQHL